MNRKSHFTPEQVEELEKRYGLKPVQETVKVRDGTVAKGDMVWWREVSGPKHIKAGEHWENIEKCPDCYQLAEPLTRVDYVDL